MNARFWVWGNDGWVKLTLRAGQTLVWAHFSRHDEGWSSSQVKYLFDGQTVRREWLRDGTDCDGRLRESGADECRASRLADIAPVDEPTQEDKFRGQPIRRPDWREAEATEVYDQFAQVANY